jgi:Ca2+-binding RTX toxin-like protein
VHDGDPAALAAILAEWTSGRTYAERVNNIRDGSGSATRLNGTNYLTAIDDNAADVLTGSQGQDWFIFNNDSLVQDKATDLKSGEFSDEDLAFIGS